MRDGNIFVQYGPGGGQYGGEESAVALNEMLGAWDVELRSEGGYDKFLAGLKAITPRKVVARDVRRRKRQQRRPWRWGRRW